MTATIFVTEAQVRAAKLLVARDEALGRDPDLATSRIADARQERPADRAPAALRFWDALDPAEQQALEAVASLETFPPGTPLMRQGEPANEVVVILGGRAKVSVESGGHERVLAVRGLHQLVGESAAFHERVRSATVTALEMVWAMVVQGEDFKAFINGHPRVLDILYAQFYERLVEPRKSDPGQAGQDQLSDLSRRRHLDVFNGENCTVIRCGAAGLGTGETSDRLPSRNTLVTMIAAALPGVPALLPHDRGDGLLIVVPPSVSTADVMTRLRKELSAVIDQHNRNEQDSVPIQLRLVVNVGPVFGDDSGVTGEGVTVASELMRALNSDGAVPGEAILAIVISPFVFETVIRPGQDLDEEASYTPLPVTVRGSSTNAWLKVISGDLPAGNSQP